MLNDFPYLASYDNLLLYWSGDSRWAEFEFSKKGIKQIEIKGQN